MCNSTVSATPGVAENGGGGGGGMRLDFPLIKYAIQWMNCFISAYSSEKILKWTYMVQR